MEEEVIEAPAEKEDGIQASHSDYTYAVPKGTLVPVSLQKTHSVCCESFPSLTGLCCLGVTPGHLPPAHLPLSRLVTRRSMMET